MIVVTMPCSQLNKTLSIGGLSCENIEQISDNFQLKNYFRSINFMSEVITMANSEIADGKEFLRKELIMHD